MSDLIERLRQWPNLSPSGIWRNEAGPICNEAADEIERLRADLAIVDRWRAKLAARNAKLEKVLEAAKVYWDNTPDTTYSQAVALRDAIADAEASK